MKKFISITIVVLFVLASLSTVFYEQKKQASAIGTSGFAQINYNNVYLYKSPTEDESLENKYFLLEESYFVKVTEDTNDFFYKVEYLNITGYVKKSNLSFVAEIPNQPYLVGITLDIPTTPALLRSEPTTKNGDESIMTIIPKLTKDLTYYGKIAGEESVNSLGNIWYYISFTTEFNQTFSGYVYSPQTINLSPITKNEESLTTVNISAFTPLDTLLYLNLSTKNIMLLIITLPTVAILYLLVKPTKNLKQ